MYTRRPTIAILPYQLCPHKTAINAPTVTQLGGNIGVEARSTAVRVTFVSAIIVALFAIHGTSYKINRLFKVLLW